MIISKTKTVTLPSGKRLEFAYSLEFDFIFYKDRLEATGRIGYKLVFDVNSVLELDWDSVISELQSFIDKRKLQNKPIVPTHQLTGITMVSNLQSADCLRFDQPDLEFVQTEIDNIVNSNYEYTDATLFFNDWGAH